jgi:hypothetical protein
VDACFQQFSNRDHTVTPLPQLAERLRQQARGLTPYSQAKWRAYTPMLIFDNPPADGRRF